MQPHPGFPNHAPLPAHMRAFMHVLLLGLGLSAAAAPVRAQADRTICIADPSHSNAILSTYSPCVLHKPGWDRYRMYFGRNEEIGGWWADRIYLSESFSDGIADWGEPILLLEPDVAFEGEGGLIHDPTVDWVDGTWHMYYTGTDKRSIGPGEQWHNRIFHATSADGVSWQRQGAAAIDGLPAQGGTYGYGEPSLLMRDGEFWLYFFSDADPGAGTVMLATGTDGQAFTCRGRASGIVVTAPEVARAGGEYLLVASSGFVRIVLQRSADPSWFGGALDFEVILETGPPGAWDARYIGLPFAMPRQSRLYYAGMNDPGDAGGPMSNAQIGVTHVVFMDTAAETWLGY